MKKSLKSLITLIIMITIVFAFNAQAKIKVATYNIRNFDYDVRGDIHTNKDHLKKLLKGLNADLIAVQEIVQDRVFIHFIDRYMPEYDVILTECGGQNGQKLGFVYNKSKLKLLSFKEDLRLSIGRTGQTPACNRGSRPAMIANFKHIKEGFLFTSFAVHLKSGGQPSSIDKRFFQINTITSIVKEYKARGMKNFILMGDFNSTQYIHQKAEYKRFLDIFNSSKLTDLSNKINCTSYWFGGLRDDKQYPSILDHIIVSEFFKKKTPQIHVHSHCAKLSCSVTPDDQLGVSFDQVSDHCPMTATLN
jgi:endonuclease/exonuclease/phosphatase family metal-dependent hydrolase